jgi:hypothetical protein
MKKILTVLVLAGVLGGAYGLYLFNKPAESAVSGKSQVSIDATDLVNNYRNNEEDANAAYLNKIVTVSGTIANINSSENSQSIILASSNPLSSVVCEMAVNSTKYEVGNQITIKGLCAGYLQDVLLTKCVISN